MKMIFVELMEVFDEDPMMQMLVEDYANYSFDQAPLIIDLDGTLVRSDLCVESVFAFLGRNPLRVFELLSSLRHGKAAVKSLVATKTGIDAAHLPYDEDVLKLVRGARALGRPVYLASASNERYVRAVAEHLGLFDGWFASSGANNLSASAKAVCLVEAFEKGGFDYVGNARADLPVWAVARRRVGVHVSRSVRARLLKIDDEAVFLEDQQDRLGAWMRLLRIHQWAKNALVFVPLLTAQRFNLLSIGESVGAFVAFSLAASAIYIFNDLVDLDADRKHPSKKQRPLAAGKVPILEALAAAPILLVVAIAVAGLIAPWFAAVVLSYAALSMAYTFLLKRKMMVDIVALASLYTIRVIGGAAAISVPVSEWLLGFSMLIFTALALIKRYVELASRLDADLPDPTNRNYRKSDLSIIAALAAAAGFNAVTLFALYISSDTVRHLYRHPAALWLICPILLYWLGRALLIAHRRTMHDDPIVFALKDWNSILAIALIAIIMIGAI